MQFSNGFTQTSGALLLNGGNVATTSGPLLVQGGTLAGSGTISGNVTVGQASGAPAVLSPGFPPGTLNITGDLTLLGTSLTLIELGGTTQGVNYDFINVGGTATFNGSLAVNFTNGFASSVVPTDVFTVLTAGSPIAGSFTNVLGGARVPDGVGSGSFVVNYGAGSPFGMYTLVLTDFQPVPEPSTWSLLSLGAVTVLYTLRRRRRRSSGGP